MKSKLFNNILIISLMIIAVCTIAIASITACSTQEKIKLGGPYPNTIAENAKISDKYKDISNKLSESAIEEFLAMTKIPRESGHMDEIRNYIMNWSQTNNAKATLDPSGCIYIDVDASPGHENDKNLIIQAHMDMVVTYDNSYAGFNKDTSAINAVYDKDNGEIHSKDFKTSIGADDGQGIAMCLSIAKHTKEFDHGPLRLLFTYDEETTMDGAKLLDANVLNANVLINYDNSPCGLAAVSSTGVLPIEFNKKYKTSEPNDNNQSENITFKIGNLKGGHAGFDITKNRISASAFLIDYLSKLKEDAINFKIVSIDCGQAHNAIPGNFTLTININKENENDAITMYDKLLTEYRKNHKDDSDFTYEFNPSEATGQLISQQDSLKIVDSLKSIPNGLIKMSDKYEDVAENSCNIGIIKISDGNLYCRASYRTSDAKVLEEQKIKIPADLKSFDIDCTINEDDINPAWDSGDSNLIKIYEKAMKDECKINPTLTGIHAALETAVFYNKKHDLQTISIGGDVKDEHMTSETFYTKTYPVAIVPILYVMDHINEI